jgi:hypothetical protein
LRVPCAAERPGEIARDRAQPPAVVPQIGVEQPQQRPPALHLPTEIVDGRRIRLCRIVDGYAGIGENIASDGEQCFADRQIGP